MVRTKLENTLLSAPPKKKEGSDTISSDRRHCPLSLKSYDIRMEKAFPQVPSYRGCNFYVAHCSHIFFGCQENFKNYLLGKEVRGDISSEGYMFAGSLADKLENMHK